jgi:uncharacterized protein with NAD-binding domain and iron-sulfur cluster
LSTAVDGFVQDGEGWVVRAGGELFRSDGVVLAVSFEAMQRLLPLLPENEGGRQLRRALGEFHHSPITSVHLWFDREVTSRTHAALLDATIEWMYNKTALHEDSRHWQGSYLELVISASKDLVPMKRQEIIDLALRELKLFVPAVKEARLVKAAVTKEVRATYSIRPLLDRVRPGARSAWSGIYLAGDWTATGWPSTMESAVRSGYLAAEALTEDGGERARFLVPDLPATGLMRFLVDL